MVSQRVRHHQRRQWHPTPDETVTINDLRQKELVRFDNWKKVTESGAPCQRGEERK